MTSLSKKVSFPGYSGERLAARLDFPVFEPRAWAVFAHCFTCSKDLYAAARVSRALTQHGIAVLRFDFTGLGASGGDFANTNFSSNVADLLCAVDYLRENYQAPALIIGHSLGGAAVLAAAGLVPEAKAVVSIGAPASPEHVAHLFGDKVEELKSSEAVQVMLAGREFTIQRQFLDDITQQSQQQKLKKLGKALLVMHSPQDETVGINNAAEIYAAALHPKSFVSLDGADHLLRKKSDADYAAELISAWVGRYLPPGKSPVADNGVSVREAGVGKFLTAVYAGKHQLLADEPVSYGGSDLGPSPYDYLLAGLGSCTSTTIRLYAERKGWPLESVKVSLQHRRVHADDCEECFSAGEAVAGKLEVIDRQLELIGDLDSEQRQRLLEIADRCPVHKTLTGKLHVTTRLLN